MTSGGEMESMYFALLDSSNQIVRSLKSGDIELFFIENLQPGLATSIYSQFISMKNTINWRFGSFALQNLTVVGEPGRIYSLEITSNTLINLDLL